jgi:Universal stress protein family
MHARYPKRLEWRTEDTLSWESRDRHRGCSDRARRRRQHVLSTLPRTRKRARVRDPRGGLADESGEFALLEAANAATARANSELHVVHVIDEHGAAAESGDALVGLERRLAKAPATLERQITRLYEVLPTRVTAHVRAGQPARSILQTAIDVNADLLVSGPITATASRRSSTLR